MNIAMEKEIYCTECKSVKKESKFYQRVISACYNENNNLTGICKECLIAEFQSALENFKGNVIDSIDYICSKYNLPFVRKLILTYREGESGTKAFKEYMRSISSLPQYRGMRYEKGDKEKEVEYKSDIDFLEEDIKSLRMKIVKALEHDDVNAHGKWMNSLREACRLKSDLERDKKTPTKWELKWSKYKIEDDIPMISIWEQNQDGEVRSVEKFRLYDNNMLKKVISLTNQIHINDYMDSNGHDIKHNRSYVDIIDYLDLQSVKENNSYNVIDKSGNTICKLEY